MTAFPVTQGFIPSFKSAAIDVGGRPCVGIKGITWDESCEGEIEYGNGPIPLGVTVGEYAANVEIEQLISEYTQVIQRLGSNYRSKFFNLGVQFDEPGVSLITVDFTRIKIASNSGSWAGKPGTTIKYKCQVFSPIRINGLSMVDRFLSGSTFSIGASVNVSAGGLVSAGAGVSASFGL